MTGIRGLLVLLLTAVLAGCAGTGPRSTGGYKVGSPYQVKGVWYQPREQPNYNETGLASWYGPGFHGRRTANGEVYNQRALTAAHTTLPMPVNVRVTNLDNGRSLVVRVNDRGPFHPGRIIDVSARSAELLGFKERGTARVRVEYLGRADRDGETMIAARTPPAEGEAPKAAPTARVASVSLAPAGTMPTMAPIPNPIASMSPIPDPAPSTDPAEKPIPSMAPISNPADSPTYVIGPEPPAASALAAPELRPISARAGEARSGGRLYVQVGAFSDSGNAVALYYRILGVGKASVSPLDVGGRLVYRVRLGPVADADEASRITANLKARGHSGAQIVME